MFVILIEDQFLHPIALIIQFNKLKLYFFRMSMNKIEIVGFVFKLLKRIQVISRYIFKT